MNREEIYRQFEEMLARADSLSAQVDRLYEKNREKKPGE